ncbi:MAG: hypothetical protein V4605_10325 [Pseudomonadota bacterium]
MNNIAFITSTINPNPDVFLLKRISVSERLKDYETAFRFYCGMLNNGIFDCIVYVDNSGYTLSSLENIAIELNVRDKVEFISYQSKDSPDNSRYFLEINLIQYGMNASYKVIEAKSPMIWKITGRYLIQNIDKIIRELNRNVDLYINFRNKPYKVADFYLVGFSEAGYEGVLGRDVNLYKGKIDGERILREQIENQEFKELNVVTRFRYIPRVYGIRGFDNKSYNNMLNTSKYYFRVGINYIFPRLWL